MAKQHWTSEELKKADAEHIVGTYARFDVAIEKGKNATCWDYDGKSYVDLTSGIGVNSLGFADEEWSGVVAAQAQTLQHASNLYYTAPMVELATALSSRTGMSKVFFANSGAEANECAIKAARKYGNTRSENKRNTIITLENGFHGRTVATITATGQEHYHTNFYPFAGGFAYCPAGDVEALSALVDDTTCAVMLELIQGEGGVIPVDPEFVRAAEQLCRERDMLLIIDEIQTGIGRTGTLFCYEQYGVSPDIVTFAKGIASGLPLGGALFNERTKDILEAGDHGTTFGANPVATAAGCVVLDRLTDDFLAEVVNKGRKIRELLDHMPQVYDVSGLGLMLGFKVKDREAADVVRQGMDYGLLMLTAKDKVRLLPPLTISEEELDRALTLLWEILFL